MSANETNNKRTILVLGLAAGLLLIAGAFALLGNGVAPGEVPEPLGSDDMQAAISQGDGTSADDTADPMDSIGEGSSSEAESEAEAIPVTTSDSSDTDSPSGSTDSEGESSSDDPPTTVPSDAGVLAVVRFSHWNDTVDRPLTDLIISLGDDSWTPADMEASSAEGSFEDIEIGQKLMLVIFPDGDDGTRIEVPVIYSAEMASGSERDAIHVEVTDTNVRVLGNPVENVDVTFDRF